MSSKTMLSLQEEIEAHKCQMHKRYVSFLCTQKICQHSQRMMCDRCLNLSSHPGTLNIGNLFSYLNDYESKEQIDFYSFRAKIWQQMKHCQIVIQYLVEQLVDQTEVLLDSIQGDSTIIDIKHRLFGTETETTLDDITQLAESLADVLECQIDNSYSFTQISPIDQHNNYIHATKNQELFNGTILQLREGFQVIMQNIVVNQQIQPPQQPHQGLTRFQVTYTRDLLDQSRYICFNHDEKYIAVSVGNQISIVSITTGNQIQPEQILIGHVRHILQAKFNHDSTKIVSCGQDRFIIIWEKDENQRWIIKQTLGDMYKSSVISVCFNHNSTILASGSGDAKIHLFIQKNRKWELQQTLTNHTSNVNDLHFNHDSTLLASCSSDKSVKLWKFGANEWIESTKFVNDHTKGIMRVLFFGEQSTSLLSCGQDNKMILYTYNLENGIWNKAHELNGHTDAVCCTQFIQASRMIVSSSKDGLIRIWELNNEVWQHTETISAHRNQSYCAMTNDSQLIVSTSLDRQLKLLRRHN